MSDKMRKARAALRAARVDSLARSVASRGSNDEAGGGTGLAMDATPTSPHLAPAADTDAGCLPLGWGEEGAVPPDLERGDSSSVFLRICGGCCLDNANSSNMGKSLETSSDGAGRQCS